MMACNPVNKQGNGFRCKRAMNPLEQKARMGVSIDSDKLVR